MKTAEFDYHLPDDLIAQHPPPARDQSRLMIVHRANGRIEHRLFTALPDHLEATDLLVLNNTRVVPARIFGKKEGSGGRVEVFMLEDLGDGIWDVLLRARRRPAIGARVMLADGQAIATMLDEGDLGRARIRITSDRPWMELMEQHGLTPLPPYIRRTAEARNQASEEDKARYQTIYASEKGAVAAPTAGLHFTPEIFARLDAKGVKRAELTLHVGLGTFRPVTAEKAEDHTMESERFSISAATAEIIRSAKRVVAVGSTTVRTLEYVAATHGRMEPSEGRADLFIRPPYEFRVVGAMLTNFHLPRSTLLMMVCAFGGKETILRAYEEAVRERYRFYSYGDCMLIV